MLSATPAEPAGGIDLSDLHCPDCRYALRGLTSDRCPECGFALELIRSPQSQIPWERRRELGRARAFWQTVFYVTRNSRRFGFELYRPLDDDAARHFIWFTAARLFAVGLIAAYVIAWLPSEFANRLQAEGRIAALLAAPGLTLLFIAAVSQPRDCIRHSSLPPAAQRSAATMTDYVSGIFAWLAPSWLAVTCAVAVIRDMVFALPLFLGALLAGAVVMYLFSLARIAARILPDRSALVAFFVQLALNWLLLLAIVLAAAWMLFYLLFLIFDLRLT